MAALPQPETIALAASPSYVARDFMSHASELRPGSQAARGKLTIFGSSL